MVVGMGAEPARGKRPEGIDRSALSPVAHGIGKAPDVAVMVGHEPSRAVVGPGRPGPADPEVVQKLHQRLMHLRQICSLRRPVVHLRIDVDRIVGAPRRAQVLVPDALQVRRKGSRSGACYQQIAAILEQQRISGGIHVLIPVGKPLRRRKLFPAGSQVDLDTVEISPVIFHMPGGKGIIVRFPGGPKVFQTVFPIGLPLQEGLAERSVEARPCRQVQGDAVRPRDLQALRQLSHRPALLPDGEHGAEPHALLLWILLIDDRIL